MKCPRKIYIVAAQRNTDRVRDVDDWRVETFVKGD